MRSSNNSIGIYGFVLYIGSFVGFGIIRSIILMSSFIFIMDIHPRKYYKKI